MKPRGLEQFFKYLGMSKHAFAVYEIIRTQGPLLASRVVSGAHLYRPAAYQALYQLLNYRLIGRVQKGKRFLWQIENPKIIDELFKQTVLGIKQASAPDHSPADVLTSTVKILHGPEGVRSVFDDVVTHTPRGQTFYRYTSERDLDAVNSYLSPQYRQLRDQKRLERLVISNPLSGSRKRPRLERFIKFIPPEANLFDQNIIQIIYGDRVAFIDLSKETAFILENRALAEFQKIIFQQLYKKL